MNLQDFIEKERASRRELTLAERLKLEGLRRQIAELQKQVAELQRFEPVRQNYRDEFTRGEWFLNVSPPVNPNRPRGL